MRRVDLQRFDGGVDVIEAYTVSDFPYHNLFDYEIKVRHRKDLVSYYKVFATFDIESTTIIPTDTTKAPFGFMYHWQMVVGGFVCYGRTWEEWFQFINNINEWLGVDIEHRIVIYVHNLSYEFQFIKDFLNEKFGGFTVFATGSRKPLRVVCNNGVEFRCSYMLTNMSLAKACENEKGTVHKKAVGDLDYRIRRTAITPLDDIEFGYCIADVISLYEMIYFRMLNEHDNLESIPMTSTGYVRRDCRKATRQEKKYRKMFIKNKMTSHIYKLLLEAGRGGNTHANRYMAGRLWHFVHSFDVASSYPAQILLRKFPMTKFTLYGSVDTMEELHKLLNEYACLFKVMFVNLKVKEEVTMPYIPISKVLIRGSKYMLDNGRVMELDKAVLTLTDIDFKIIEKQYTWDSIAISEMHIAKYGDLPKSIRDKVLDYFKLKTELKDKIKHCDNDEERADLEYLYAKSKNRLNGIFGMCYTNPVRPVISINEDGEWVEELPDIEEALEHYNKSRNSFLVYAWGVWITAWARLHLQDLLDATGEATIYCDTDSSKAIMDDEGIKRVYDLNDKIRKQCDERGAYVDYNDTRYYMGVYELETPIPYKEFKTLGAKKYAYTDEKGLHVTISGVNKKIGAKELKSIDNFKPGFIFKEAGGQTLYYNDIQKPVYVTIDGCRMLAASNIGMVDSTYELGITDEYSQLIGYNLLKELM